MVDVEVGAEVVVLVVDVLVDSVVVVKSNTRPLVVVDCVEVDTVDVLVDKRDVVVEIVDVLVENVAVVDIGPW